MRNLIAAKVIFCNISLAKCLFFQSQTSRFGPKNHQKKKPGNKHEQTHFLIPKYLKSSQNGVPKSTRNGGKSAHGPQSTFVVCQDRPKVPQDAKVKPPSMPNDRSGEQRCPLLCSPVSQDRPRVTQDAKVKPPSMSNDRSGYQRCQDPLATMPRICNPKAMSNDRGPAAEGVAHKIILEIYTQKNIQKIFFEKNVVYLSNMFENVDSQIWKNKKTQDVPIYFLIFFEVFWYKKGHKYGVRGPRNDR